MTAKRSSSKSSIALPSERIERKILLIRGQKALLDRDLAELYDVETRVLVQAVKRNREGFPPDFRATARGATCAVKSKTLSQRPLIKGYLTDGDIHSLSSEMLMDSTRSTRKTRISKVLPADVIIMLNEILNAGKRSHSSSHRLNSLWQDDQGMLHLRLTGYRHDDDRLAGRTWGESLARTFSVVGVVFACDKIAMHTCGLTTTRAKWPRHTTRAIYHFLIDPVQDGFTGKLRRVLEKLAADEDDHNSCQARLARLLKDSAAQENKLRSSTKRWRMSLPTCTGLKG